MATDHLALSASRSPSEAFTFLQIPVVGLGGNLDENALQSAHRDVQNVEAIDDVDDDTVDEVSDLLEAPSREAVDSDVGA